MTENMKIYDTIGIGFGPANIAVAIAMEELQFQGQVKFLESRKDSTWQENMLLENSDIQNHPLRDLATPRNPRSKYSFTNFLFENNRLYEHLNTGLHLPYRIEFAQYVAWVSDHFKSLVEYNTHVEKIELIDENEALPIYKIIDTKGQEFFSYSVIVAPGREPNIPKEFQSIQSDRLVHLTGFLKKLKEFPKESLKKIAVIGGSQSAVEIILHLAEQYPDSEITGMTRVFGYKQKDVNPFTGEVYYPSFVDLFYKSDDQTKKRLINDLNLTNYSASDADVLDELYHKMYRQKITGKQKIFIHRCTDIINVSEAAADTIEIQFNKVENEDSLSESFDLVVLATGFKNLGTGINEEPFPKILENVMPHFKMKEDDYLRINIDYSIPFENNSTSSCFLNGLCESSHGMGDAGSFSLLALRSGDIVNALSKNLIQLKNKSLTNQYLNQ